MRNREVFREFVLAFFVGLGTSVIAEDIQQVFFGIPTDIATKYFAALVFAAGFAIWGKRK